MIGWVIEECLEGKISVRRQRGFDDQFLIGTVLIDERRNPSRKRARGQRADADRG